MLPLFLTSMGFYDEHVLNRFLDLVENNKLDKQICFIITAIRKSDRLYHITKTKEIFENVGFSKVDFMDIEYDDPSKLREYPIIVIFGGDPFSLMEQVKKSNTDSILKELRNTCLIAGHSSGAAILGKTIKHANLLHPEWNIINLTEFDGVGMLQEAILPHYNRYMGKEELLTEFEQNEKVTLLRIEDGQWFIV